MPVCSVRIRIDVYSESIIHCRNDKAAKAQEAN